MGEIEERRAAKAADDKREAERLAGRKAEQAARASFWEGLVAALVAAGASATFEPEMRILNVNGVRVFSYDLTEINNGSGYYRDHKFSGKHQFTLKNENYTARYARNLVWRTQKDGSWKFAEIAEAVISWAKARAAREAQDAANEAARDALRSNESYEAFTATARAKGVYPQNVAGKISLDLRGLDLATAEKILDLLGDRS